MMSSLPGTIVAGSFFIRKDIVMRIGEWNTLKVIRSKEHGVYLGEDDSRTADTVLLPRKQVPEGVKAGQMLDVFIYRDSQDRMIATTGKPYITMGEIKRLTVKSVTPIGAFMDWGLEKDILLPYKEQTAKVAEGRQYAVRMYEDRSGRLCVSMKLYGYLKPVEGYEAGDSFSGIVYEYKKGMGAFVAVDDTYSGLIHENELYERVMVGDIVNGRIVKIREDGRVDLSLRDLAYKQLGEDSEMVYNIIKSYHGVLPFTDKADKDIIRKEFGLSKNAFKRAVGHLLKERRIVITDSTIEIIAE